MPKDTVLVIGAIALPFVVFAVVLAWTDYWTRKA
jgi:hypothetical protein